MFERSGPSWKFRETVYSCPDNLVYANSRVSGDGKTLVIACSFGDHISKKWLLDSYSLKSDSKEFDSHQFGSSVSISHDGNTIAVGSWEENQGNGTVYISLVSRLPCLRNTGKNNTS